MTQPAQVLHYDAGAASPVRRRRLLFVWLLPVLLLPGSLGSRRYVGDEYFGFIMAHLPGGWVAELIRIEEWGLSMSALLTAIMAANLLVVVLLGAAMDVLRVRWWVSIALPPLLFAATVASGLFVLPIVSRSGVYATSPYDPAALFVVYCWSLYLPAVGAIIVAVLVRVVRLAPARRSVRSLAPGG